MHPVQRPLAKGWIRRTSDSSVSSRVRCAWLNPFKRSALSVGHVDSGGANSKNCPADDKNPRFLPPSESLCVSAWPPLHTPARDPSHCLRAAKIAHRNRKLDAAQDIFRTKKNLGSEHHKCSRCRHFVQRGSHGHHDGPPQPASFEYPKIDSNSAKNSLKRHWLLSPQASSSVPQEHVESLRCATPSSRAPRPRLVLAPQTQQTLARCTPPLVLALRARLTGVLLELAQRSGCASNAVTPYAAKTLQLATAVKRGATPQHLWFLHRDASATGAGAVRTA